MNTERLRLPVSDKFPVSDRWLSMDEYVEFVNFCSRYFPRKKMSKKEWLALHRGVPFSIK